MVNCENCQREFRDKRGLNGHLQFSKCAATMQESAAAILQQPSSYPSMDELARHLDSHEDSIVERIVQAVARLNQDASPEHPPGFCQTAHCQQARLGHYQAITRAAGDKIFSILSKAAKNLGHYDVADELAREYMAIAAGNDYGPGFYIGETRMYSSETLPPHQRQRMIARGELR